MRRTKLGVSGLEGEAHLGRGGAHGDAPWERPTHSRTVQQHSWYFGSSSQQQREAHNKRMDIDGELPSQHVPRKK
ncbi:hypothetical protein LR48_Vigan03g093300 [Vigna angularis]|uniref:Uncharacterized protein n=1 Tax=Phaseolus angularis TaxID=3914 RepID=A0A0L9U452_PHAAN|nr:hypothetical protein LR48_Vigan03g093300 [Vigna angularis]